MNLKPYKGFINPTITPVYGKQGQITDYQVVYKNNFIDQHIEYVKKYSFESALSK